MERICVYCGSSPGAKPEYAQAARELGKVFAEENIELVYGGGGIGIMGEISNAVINAGGRVIGVIPEALATREVANANVSDLRIVKNMHERKAMMAKLSDAFIALPGGIGTLEEFAEIITWAQLGIQDKPCGLLNVADYYKHFIAFLDHSVREGFLKTDHREIIIVDTDPRRLVERLQNFRMPPPVGAWVEKVD